MLKVVTVMNRRVYIYPTTKGLVREADEVKEAFMKVRPTAVGLSLSDRELAEVRLALEGEAPPEHDYVPESHRPGDEGGEGEEGDEVGGETGEDGVDEVGGEAGEDGADEADSANGGDGEVPDELSMPGGVVRREEVEEVMDEPFAPDLMAADSAARGDRIFISDTDMSYSRKLAAFGDVELPPPAFREVVQLAERTGVPIGCLDLDDDAYTEAFVVHVTYWQLLRHSRTVRRMRRLRASGPEQLALEWDRRIRAIKGFATIERKREGHIAAGLLDLLSRHDRVLAVVDLPLVEGVVAEMGRLAAGARPAPGAPDAPDMPDEASAPG